MANVVSTVSVSYSKIAPLCAVSYIASMKLPLRIRDIRQKQGLTLRQLASAVTVSVPHMSQVERGVKNVNNHLLERIAQALGVEPYELIVNGPPDHEALMHIYAQLSHEDQERLQTFARNLLLSAAPPQG